MCQFTLVKNYLQWVAALLHSVLTMHEDSQLHQWRIWGTLKQGCKPQEILNRDAKVEPLWKEGRKLLCKLTIYLFLTIHKCYTQ